MMHTVIGIDPGRKTGLVVLHNVNYQLGTFDLAAHYTIEWNDRQLIYSILRNEVRELDAIVMENFLLYPSLAMEQSYQEMPSSKVIERVTVYAELLEITHLIKLQLASVNFIAKGKKRQLAPELHKQLKTQHEIDALLHCIYFIAMNKRRTLDENII